MMYRCGSLVLCSVVLSLLSCNQKGADRIGLLSGR